MPFENTLKQCGVSEARTPRSEEGGRRIWMDLVDRWSLVLLKLGSMHVNVSLEVGVFDNWGAFLGPKNLL